jgi:two-component system chemotaxis response regulator CheB
VTPSLRVLLVEDSPTLAEFLKLLVDHEPDMQLIGHARDGVEAVEMTARLRPDVIAMDVNMPGLDGFAATKRIMTECPTPIVIASATMDVSQVSVSMAALDAGALAVVEKPVGVGSPRYEELARGLINSLRAMAGMKLVRRHDAATGARMRNLGVVRGGMGSGAPVVAIAASTGGPAALGCILPALPRNLAAPVLIVQHIATGFVGGLATWLDQLGSLRVRVATDGESLEAGHVYLAGDGRHLGISHARRVQYSDADPIGGFRPAANHLFETVARVAGADAICVILTGMGRDGVEGLRFVRGAGGHVVAQDAGSAVVNGMPGAAVAAGVADAVVPLAGIAGYIARCVARSVGK